MKKSRSFESGGELYLAWHCPACNQEHHVPVLIGEKGKKDRGWNWNGNLDSPTLSPSVKISSGKYVPEWEKIKHRYDNAEGKKWIEENSSICHFFITDGNVRYCGDCTHSYNGKIISLPNQYKQENDEKS